MAPTTVSPAPSTASRKPSRTRRLWAIVSLLGSIGAAPLFTGCGGSAGGLCSRAVDCDYIDDSDYEECTSDLERAVRDGDITGDDIDRCYSCVSTNDCGLDQLLDCSSDCEDVSGIVFGSVFN